MTVIVWDGQTLAADRRCSFGAYIGEMTKIRRVGNALAGIAGPASKASEFFIWFEAELRRLYEQGRTDARGVVVVVNPRETP